MGMVQGRCGTGFPSKTIHSLAVSGKLFREEFQRHRAAQTGVLGFVDDTHSSATQLLKDSKMQNGLSDHNKRSLLLAGHVRPGPHGSKSLDFVAISQKKCQRNFLPELWCRQARVSGQDDDVRRFLQGGGINF